MSDILFNLWKTAEFGHETQQEKYRYLDAYHAVEWYVNTGRAPTGWVKALARADPKKLLDYILEGDNQSTEGQAARATAYLERYCRLEEAVWGTQPGNAARNIVLKLTKDERDLLVDALSALSAERTGNSRYKGPDEEVLAANREYVHRIAALHERVASAVPAPARKKAKHTIVR